MSRPTEVTLSWDGDLRFSAESGNVRMVLDSESVAGPSPVQTLAFALAGCMAMDVVHILTKSRAPIRGVRASLTATRADADPRRFVRIDLRFAVDGVVQAAQVERAVALSREKYCSVWHSMRQDIDFHVSHEVTGEGH